MGEAARAAFVRATAPVMLLAQLLREQKGDPKRAIAWAESLWEALVAAGYGPKSRAEARPTATRVDPKRDALAALTPELAASFARLWTAYAWPKAKQAAAERWGQLAPDAALAERIIAAAAAEAREPRPEGQVRKWLQGWLSERRWEDWGEGVVGLKPDLQEEVAARRLAVAELLGEHKRLVLHCQHHPDDAGARAELGRIGERLTEHGITPGSATPKLPTDRGRGGPRSLKSMLGKLAPTGDDDGRGGD